MQLITTVQEGLVAILCYGEVAAARQIIEMVPTRTFDSYYSDVARAAEAYIIDFGETPKDHTLDLVQDLLVRYPKRAKMIERVYHSTTSAWESAPNVKFWMRQASTFARHRDLKDGVAEIIDHLEKDSVEGTEEAESVVRKLSQKRAQTGYDDEVILQDTSKSLDFLDMDEEYLPIGIAPFDDLQLGPVRGGLHLLTSTAKGGKTTYLFWLMKQALLHGYTGLYIGLELRREFCCRRAYQTLFSISRRHASNLTRVLFEKDEHDKFLDLREVKIPRRPSMQDDDIAAHLIERIERFKNRPPFIIKTFPSGRLTMNGLEAYLDHLLHVRKIAPDLVCLDYPDLMRLDRKKDKRDAVGEAYVDFRGLAGDRNFAGAVVSQINRSGSKDGDSDATDVAEDWSKIATADSVLNLNQTRAEQRLGVARLRADRMRDGPGGLEVMLSQNLDLGQFCMDWVKMSSSVKHALYDPDEEDREAEEDR